MSSDSLADRTLSAVTLQYENWTLQRLLLYTIVFTLVLIVVLPLEVAVVTSFKTRVAVTETLPHVPLLPWNDGFTLDQWVTAFDILKGGLVNSFLRAVPATVLTALLGSLAAYGLTHIDWRGQLFVLLLFVSAVFFPTQAAIVPLARFWSVIFPLEDVLAPVWTLPFLHEYHGDLLALIISDVAYGLPVVTVLFRGYYQTIDRALIESARMDGASVFRIYQRIVLPLSMPMFAVVFIYQFTQVWNSFLFPLIIMTSSNHPVAPATLALTGLGQALEGVNYGLRMSGALLTALPTVIVFILAGDKFAEGITSGEAG